MVAEEAERIAQSKGQVFCLDDEPGVHRIWRPNGETPGLALSRALGDYCLKEFGLISVPDVTQWNITSRDKFVILATDGVCIFLMMVPTLSFPLFWLGPSDFLLITQLLSFFPLLITTHYNFHCYCE